jgi:hypothetical protein
LADQHPTNLAASQANIRRRYLGQLVGEFLSARQRKACVRRILTPALFRRAVGQGSPIALRGQRAVFDQQRSGLVTGQMRRMLRIAAAKFREGQKLEQRLSAVLKAGGSHGAKSRGHHLGQLDASAATVLISDEAFGTALHDAINERTNIADKSLSIGIVPVICGALFIW